MTLSERLHNAHERYRGNHNFAINVLAGLCFDAAVSLDTHEVEIQSLTDARDDAEARALARESLVIRDAEGQIVSQGAFNALVHQRDVAWAKQAALRSELERQAQEKP